VPVCGKHCLGIPIFANPRHLPSSWNASGAETLEVLTSTLNKLDQGVIRIAAFGLGRGKSAVLNALLGQKILQTGPLNGVTQWPVPCDS